MSVCALGYLQLTAVDRAAWTPFARDVLGLQVEDGPAATRLRLDGRAFRIEILDGVADEVTVIGWEVPDRETMVALAEDIRATGAEVVAGDDEDAHARG